MDAIAAPPPQEYRLLPALADAITEWFPELGGRALAVSDMLVDKQNTPTLPLVLVAFVRSTANPPLRNHYEEFPIDDVFIVQFWMKPLRQKRADGSETPFWTYYPYEYVRNKLLTHLVEWMPPNKERIGYRGLTVTADQFAVVLTFQFVAHFDWCPKINRFGEVIQHAPGFNLCTPPGCVPEICEPDPCA